MITNTIILVTSTILGYMIYNIIIKKRLKLAQDISQDILLAVQQRVRQRQKEISISLSQELELRQNYQQMIAELKQSNEIMAQKQILQEKDLDYTETKLNRQQEKLEQIKRELLRQEEKNNSLEQESQYIQDKIQKTLLEKSGYTYPEIQDRFFYDFQQEMDSEYLKYQENMKEFLAINSERIASRILSAAIHRCSFSHWSESYPSSIPLEDESLLSQIFTPSLQDTFSEELDVKLEYDQGAILIVTADGCKREITRQVLSLMISNKVFTLSTIRIWIQQTRSRLEREIFETGKAVCVDLGIHLSEEIYRLLGRLKYRTSFGQNVLWHSVEVARLAKFLAYEIGLDPEMACRAGLLHDIGKAVDHEQEGGHPEIGGEILQNFAEAPEIIEGVTGHHEDVQSDTPYATLISAADAISASRPGARRETFEKYIHRLEKLESIAYEIPGVENAYAISAGREIRLIVAPDKVPDGDVTSVARNIANAIEQELHYPGKIKITVIREMKVVEYAH